MDLEINSSSRKPPRPAMFALANEHFHIVEWLDARGSGLFIGRMIDRALDKNDVEWARKILDPKGRCFEIDSNISQIDSENKQPEDSLSSSIDSEFAEIPWHGGNVGL